MTETLEVLRLVRDGLLPPPDQELFAAPVQDRVVDNLEFAQFSDELDVAQHLPLGHVLGLILGVGAARGARRRARRQLLLILLANVGAILKLIPEKIKIKTLNIYFKVRFKIPRNRRRSLNETTT